MAVNGLGDVLALVQITVQAVKILRDATQAPAEVRKFLGEIEQYQTCIALAATRLRQHGAVLKSHSGVKKNIQEVLEQCAQTTRKLGKIASRYHDIVSERGAAHEEEASWRQWMEAFKTVYRSVEWTTKADTVGKLREELWRNIQMLRWLESGLMSDQIDLIAAGLDNIQHMLSSVISSPSQTPVLGPMGSSPVPTPTNGSSEGSASQVNSPDAFLNTQRPPPAASLELPDPLLDFNFDSCDVIDSQIQIPDSFPKSTPGDQYRHVRLASSAEQQAFVDGLVAHRTFTEIPIQSLWFLFRKPGSTDSTGVMIEASDPGRLLLIKNGAAVEDIWTLNDQRTIRIRHRVPTWDEIIPYYANGEELSAEVVQGDGLTFFTIEDGQRKDHKIIPTSCVRYTFKTKSDCRQFQEVLYGWNLRLVIPVSQICRPHRGRDDDRLLGLEIVRIWERNAEMRFMVHLIQEKRRKKYLEFDLCKAGISAVGKGSGKKSTLVLSGIDAQIDEDEPARRGSSSSLASVSTNASAKSSLLRRLSWDKSLPCLDKIEIHFAEKDYRDDLLEFALSCRPAQR
ncbi:hypothetical protein PV11_08442 [Exophiala sideris]|uniref:Uncharacterized protein n=1 Tax=Exophiala sideris TaxID=1016849 RepID=A0A0D1YDE5_9EURO|nr:hypothetical protein PV11_08442 [Exophiala sideris]